MYKTIKKNILKQKENGADARRKVHSFAMQFSPTVGIDGWKVTNVRPLETLHNALTLKQVRRFLLKLSTGYICNTSAAPSHRRSTPRGASPHTLPENYLAAGGTRAVSISQ